MTTRPLTPPPALDEYLLIDIETAKLTKNKQKFGVGKMDPFVTLSVGRQSDAVQVYTRTATHWDAHKEPVWFHECPKITLGANSFTNLVFEVYNDTSMPGGKPALIAKHTCTVADMIAHSKQSKRGSLGGATKMILPLDEDNGTLTIQVKVRDGMAVQTSLAKEITHVPHEWFVSPAQRLGVSGGTAPFFSLQLTDNGLQMVQEQREETTLPVIHSHGYFLGKDLSHAEDEREFYELMLSLLAEQQDTERGGVTLLAPFLLDYLGVLQTKVNDSTDTLQLLVMENLRYNYQHFRMLDLKMGHQTAQANWQGKSRVAAMRQGLLDGITNSVAEGYRLEGFDGAPARIDSMDPLMDLLAKESKEQLNNTAEMGDKSQKKLVWGKAVTEKEMKKAKRILLQNMSGEQIFRYFIDVHQEAGDDATEADMETYTPTEMAQIVLLELVKQLVQLARTCHQVTVPQKWIGSSVALGYDAGLLPPRSDPDAATASIQSKVICKVFDWGRSELLTKRRYDAMTLAEQQDRQRFWTNYKRGMDRLAYNAAREYYHHFTNATQWTQLTLQVMDFDSLKWDDYIGKITIALPDPTDTAAVEELQSCQLDLVGHHSTNGTLYCSITWQDMPENSNMVGCWRVKIERATNLPIMDMGTSNLSDPYCIVIANDSTTTRQLHQVTCVKARTLDPVWNEIIDLPVMKTSTALTEVLAAQNVVDIATTDLKLGQVFHTTIADKQQQQHDPNGNNKATALVKDWSYRLQRAASTSS